MSLGNFCSRLLTVCVLLTIIVFQVSLAQGSGTIKGQILDQTTGESLVGANVTVENTSIGNAADLDGYYTLRLVPAGKWTLKVSYVGYKSITQEVTVADNAIVEHNFRLAPQAIAGEEVVVTAQARGQQSAINQQLTSDKISNVVSEAKLQELPDFNAAAAIGRLSGVSTLASSGEANKVVIRGLAPQYNQITVGGISLASTGSTQIGATSLPNLTSGSISNDRSVDLSTISPYMLKTVSVYKSLTSDMNANSLGGTVNMELREAPSEFHTDLLWQSGYTQKSDKYGNYRAVASVSNRFFDDKVGIYLLGNIESYDRDADNMTGSYVIDNSQNVGENGYLPVRVRNVELNRHIESRKRFGVNLIMDYKLESGSIKLINMFSRLNSVYKDYRTILNYQTRDLGFTYRDGDNDVDAAISTLGYTYDFGFMSVDLKVANTYARNSLPYSPLFQFTQTQGVGSAPVNTIPEDLTNLVTYGGTSSAYFTSMSLFSTYYQENNQSYKADLKFPINPGLDISGYIKLGGEHQKKQHRNDQNTPYANMQGGSSAIQNQIVAGLQSIYPNIVYDQTTQKFPISNFTSSNADLMKEFLDNKFGSLFWAADPNFLFNVLEYLSSNPQFSADSATSVNPGGWFNGYYQRYPNDYKFAEKYYAAYLMSELNYGDLMVVGGVRYEEEKTVFDAFNLKDGRDTRSQTYYPVRSERNNHYFLPSIQAKYRLTDWFDIRYAYNQTLARPDYHQLSPHFNMDYSRDNVWAGNPNLKPAHAYNHDLQFTLHSNEIGLISVGGFYKEIKNFTYSTQYRLHGSAPTGSGIDSVGSYQIEGVSPKDPSTLYTYINSPYMAYIRGIEFDIQTRFWYLPAPMNGIVFGANYSHIWSKSIYPWRDDRTYYPPRPQLPYTVVIDSTRSGRLINQPNDILNSYIGYDYGGFSARVSVIFQGNAVSYIGAFTEQDGFTRDYFRVDASVRQQLPWEGTEVYLDLNNLNNEANSAAQLSIGGFTSEQNYGFTANLGIRFRL